MYNMTFEEMILYAKVLAFCFGDRTVKGQYIGFQSLNIMTGRNGSIQGVAIKVLKNLILFYT